MLLGISNPEIIDHIFMLTKWYIWKSKCKGKMCEQRVLINSIRVAYENEVSILSLGVCKCSEKFKDNWDICYIQCFYDFSEGSQLKKI